MKQIYNKKLKDIEEIVCDSLNIYPSCLFQDTRKRPFTLYRFQFFFLANRHTNLSLEDIGVYAGRFRNKPYDHATVIHGKKYIKDTIEVEKKLKKKPITNYINDMSELIELRFIDIPNEFLPTDVNLLKLCKTA